MIDMPYSIIVLAEQVALSGVFRYTGVFGTYLVEKLTPEGLPYAVHTWQADDVCHISSYLDDHLVFTHIQFVCGRPVTPPVTFIFSLL